MDLLQRWFDFRGRLDRAQYWRAVVVSLCAWFLVTLVVAGVGAVFMGRGSFRVSGLLVLLASVPISVGRLHDRGKSGWWLIAFYALPVGLSYAEDAAGADLQVFLSPAKLALSIWAFVELGCLSGAVGPNKYGPDARMG